ncbi:MAG: hypothetical protein KJ811_05045 [Candidatus Margulisbacteria bacterium]|nr:hypothetical protein [Candidatus Margulisiibacteriota bacterium]
MRNLKKPAGPELGTVRFRRIKVAGQGKNDKVCLERGLWVTKRRAVPLEVFLNHPRLGFTARKRRLAQNMNPRVFFMADNVLPEWPLPKGFKQEAKESKVKKTFFMTIARRLLSKDDPGFVVGFCSGLWQEDEKQSLQWIGGIELAQIGRGSKTLIRFLGELKAFLAGVFSSRVTLARMICPSVLPVFLVNLTDSGSELRTSEDLGQELESFRLSLVDWASK